MAVRTAAEHLWPGCPLVVAYSVGEDSTALLDEFVRRGVRPDRRLFPGTGGEVA